ncbi:ABC transporter permease [Rhodobium gokarnense]|uniref:Spermidine/putrescine transport system permease protein n=1 Tax=Rhodobium gokarnense TaxID=364296 RepID=A0ABT3H6I3_9HYPH|nr:ABC transporter permease [Rhodobium gokarnense]MCW2305954.1 putative spermidine/putrescine transport system permease protein [Rhodobium gokarnense]
MARGGTAQWREPFFLLSPGVAFLVLAFFFPAFQMLVLSFLGKGGLADGLTLEHYRKLVADDFYLGVAWRTFALSIVITASSLVIGFPLAVIMSRAGPGVRRLLIVLIVLPLMTSVVIRTFGWLVILGPGGGLSWALKSLGLIDRQISLMHTEAGIVVAMVQVLLPFLVLTTLGSLNRIPPDLDRAVRTMGAGFFRALWHVTLPLSVPGLVSGSLLVFALSISSFITPSLVGGVRLPVMAGSIYQQVTGSFDWNFAAVLSVTLLAATLALIVPYMMASARMGGRQ